MLFRSAKAIGKLSGVEVLDEAVRLANEEASKLSRDAESAREKAIDLESRIQNLHGVENAKNLCDSVEEKVSLQKETENNLALLKTFTKSLCKIQNILNKNTVFVNQLEKEISLKIEYLNNCNKPLHCPALIE